MSATEAQGVLLVAEHAGGPQGQGVAAQAACSSFSRWVLHARPRTELRAITSTSLGLRAGTSTKLGELK